jgi:hypothetical protein
MPAGLLFLLRPVFFRSFFRPSGLFPPICVFVGAYRYARIVRQTEHDSVVKSVVKSVINSVVIYRYTAMTKAPKTTNKKNSVVKSVVNSIVI